MTDLLRVRESFHKFFDPIWQNAIVPRQEIYQLFSDTLGREAHVSEMSLQEIEKCSDKLLETYKIPCKRCKHFVTMRHFVPICDSPPERSVLACGKFIEKSI